ncbi:hypothetical protein [Nocardia sp. NPDC004711]
MQLTTHQLTSGVMRGIIGATVARATIGFVLAIAIFALFAHSKREKRHSRNIWGRHQ